MNFFRGLLDLINSLQRLSGDGTNPTGEKGEQTLPTLKDILNAIRGIEKSPPKRERPPLPETPKMLPFPEPQSKPEQSQPERPEPPKSTSQNKPKESAGSFTIADIIADFKKNPPKGVGEDLTPFWENQIKSIGGEPAPPGASAKPPEGSPADFTPPKINVPAPTVNVQSPGQPAPQQPQGQDTGRLAALLSSFVDGLRGLVDKVTRSKPDPQQPPQPQALASDRPPLQIPAPTESRPPLPEMPKAIEPSRPTQGKSGADFTPGQSKAKQGVFSKLSSVFGKGGSGGKVAAAGQAGGMLGGMAGAAAKLAGPVGAVLALGAAATAAVKGLYSLADGINEGNRELAKYNGQLANAFAQMDVGDRMRQMRLARNTSGTSSDLAYELDALKDDTQAMREMMATFRNTFGIAAVRLLRVGTFILENTNELRALRFIQDILEEFRNRDQAVTPPVQRAVEELATGQWRSEGQQGMFQDH